MSRPKTFQGWLKVAELLRENASAQQQLEEAPDRASAVMLNDGQRASVRAIADRIIANGVVVADEVGMGKTRIAAALVRAVVEAGGRVAILIPPGLGYQWQDELRRCGTECPDVLRSLRGFLSPWLTDEQRTGAPWFEQPVVLVSHAFSNWQIRGNPRVWRWSLLPHFYAEWRKRQTGRYPRYYSEFEDRYRVSAEPWFEATRRAAAGIAGAIPLKTRHPGFQLAADVANSTPWPGALQATEYGRQASLREWLESAVGLGLGVFDLILVDEAHKSRGHESGLSRMLGRLVIPAADARRVALTATPVELDLSDWTQVLSRVGLDDPSEVNRAINAYAASVKSLRTSWRGSEEVRLAYQRASVEFKATLSPYLLRRDKREDSAVIKFAALTGLSKDAYRQETELTVPLGSLSPSWLRSVCAAEALSVAAQLLQDPRAKTMRLTVGSGHGINAFLDSAWQAETAVVDHLGIATEAATIEVGGAPSDIADRKRRERVDWWRRMILDAFPVGESALFEHPAVLTAIRAIEQLTSDGQKVLVFGRFTKPLQHVVGLLNARAMLRRLGRGDAWAQAKVHGSPDGSKTGRGWDAVRAAVRQLRDELSPDVLELDTLDARLAAQYGRLERARERFRENLLKRVEQGAESSLANDDRRFQVAAVVQALRLDGAGADLVLLGRALWELIGHDESVGDDALALTLADMLSSAADREEQVVDENGDEQFDDDERVNFWARIKPRIDEEFGSQEARFAQLMYGATSQHTRRMMQLAFNRQQSSPQVLVAQSSVGREGLNLHTACRCVVLLHPEWNPGVVEQQIGRVDRVGSRWSQELNSVDARAPIVIADVPRIQVMAVVFQGTYDESNWQVLRERWQDLRAQLHGVAISENVDPADEEGCALKTLIDQWAPNFSPTTR